MIKIILQANMAGESSVDNTPYNLWDIALSYCLQNPEIFCDLHEDEYEDEIYTLREGVILPGQICESIVDFCQDRGFCHEDGLKVDDLGMNIFSDLCNTRLKHMRFRNSLITDRTIKRLMPHEPKELNISGCLGITAESLPHINAYGKCLEKLYIGDSVSIFENVEIKSDDHESDEDDFGELSVHAKKRDPQCHVFGGDYIFDCPNLRTFSVHGLDNSGNAYCAHDIIATILKPMRNLTCLDLGYCNVDVAFMDCLENLPCLTSLLLHNVPLKHFSGAVQLLGKLKSLKVLDLSQSEDIPVMYDNPEHQLGDLMSQLPHLVSLDISGTNLAGFISPQDVSHRLRRKENTEDMLDDDSNDKRCSIPGLEGRQLEFLGLLGCAYDACYRSDLPAKHVTGAANEDQVLLAVKTYIDNPGLLSKSMDNLFEIFKYRTCNKQVMALEAIVAAMKRHRDNKYIQVSGSASLFYIVKGEEKEHLGYRVKRKIVSAILDAMQLHTDNTTMMRNGCLTLCHFTIPQDFLFEYKRIVQQLLDMMLPSYQEEFIQRISIYLLNSLACQVDGSEKKLVGDMGAIQVMLQVIKDKLDRNLCDDNLIIAWSTMWNVTDETAVNCQRFLDDRGMELFLRCLEEFPSQAELLRNMMGLLGNVAEVKFLRPRLMTTEFVKVFSDLLESTSDGIEVSYNACGVLSHMLSDGSEAWTVPTPARNEVRMKMVEAIERWDINTRRNINYRSFEPILRLVPVFSAPEAQYWAVWALCNLTTMYPQKYCQLLEREGGLELLNMLFTDPRPTSNLRTLVERVLNRCEEYKRNPDTIQVPVPEEEEMDAEHDHHHHHHHHHHHGDN